MKYACLIYIDRERLEETSASECLAYADQLQTQGRCSTALALRAPDLATTMRIRGGRVSLTGGPYAETKEVLLGVYLLDATDLAEALDLASNIPPAPFDSVEPRPLV